MIKGIRLSYLHANGQIVVKLIAIRTAALITANRVDASVVAARRRVAFVFVDALIVIEVLNEAFRAAASKTAHEVLEIE